MACSSKVQSQSGCIFLRHGLLGDASVAFTEQEVPMGGNEWACHLWNRGVKTAAPVNSWPAKTMVFWNHRPHRTYVGPWTPGSAYYKWGRRSRPRTTRQVLNVIPKVVQNNTIIVFVSYHQCCIFCLFPFPCWSQGHTPLLYHYHPPYFIYAIL